MQNFVEKVLEALTQAGVEFIVVGGVSAVLQGVPVVTQDLDLCYRRTPENVRRLASALRSFHPKLRGLPEGVPNVVDDRTFQMRTNFTLDLEGEDLDLLAEMSGIGGYDDVAPTVFEVEVEGRRVQVLPLERLIVTKRAAGRAKDLAVLPLLEATLEATRRR
jgi:predicted nucleotidyltransferase